MCFTNNKGKFGEHCRHQIGLLANQYQTFCFFDQMFEIGAKRSNIEIVITSSILAIQCSYLELKLSDNALELSRIILTRWFKTSFSRIF